MCGCLLLKHVNELKPSLQTVEWRDSHFFPKKAIKKGYWAFLFSKLLLKLPIKCSYSILVQSEADLLNSERCVQGCWCVPGIVLVLGKCCRVLSSQAMAFAWNKLHTPSIHLRVLRCCVLLALDNVQSNYIGAAVFTAIIFLLGKIVHVRLYSLWQFWPVIFQIINSSRLNKYFWLWLCSWMELRKAK